jgi:hypothetical protein
MVGYKMVHTRCKSNSHSIFGSFSNGDNKMAAKKDFGIRIAGSSFQIQFMYIRKLDTVRLWNSFLCQPRPFDIRTI